MLLKLDDKDLKILEILRDHGDYTTRQIAKKTLLPVTTIHNRIKKLRREKIDAERRMEIIRKTIYDSGIYPDTPGPVS